MPSNNAAWLPANKTRLQVHSAPYPTPQPHEIVIRNRAVAVNPIDWILQDQGTGFAFRHITFPFVLGHDVAGEVVLTGSDVTRFRAGDRVVGQALGTDAKVNSAAHGAFQEYTVLLERVTARIPEHVTFEAACVLPLGLAAAAAGLFEETQLGLEYPVLDAPRRRKTVLVWGGSTSVGCNAIQLAVAAGYEVISTSSPKNFALLKALGASEVLDYKDVHTVGQIAASMEKKHLAGAIAIGEDSAFRCIDVLARCEGEKRLAMATLPILSQPKRFAVLQIVYHLITSMVSIMWKSRMRGIKMSIIWGSIAHSPVGDAVYRDFLPEALASGKFRPAPEAEVVGRGLDAIQEALEIQKKGVSARKVVVCLP